MIHPKQRLAWRRSTKCASGSCVEVAKTDGRVLVRNSDEPDTVVSFSLDEWSAFIDGAEEFR